MTTPTRLRLVLLAALLALVNPAGAQSVEIPERTPDNLIVASYNIQWIGQKQHDFEKLASVIAHFDVCAILEVRDEHAVRDLRDALEAHTGERWGYVFGMRTFDPHDSRAYHEAYGAVWRRARAHLGDGLVSNAWDLEQAYRNDPFCVSFASANGNFDFTMLLAHTRWTDRDGDEDAGVPAGTRENEVAMLPEHIGWMAHFVPERDWLLAGDFNYPATSSFMDPVTDRLGYTLLTGNDKTTFKQNNSAYNNPYDHIFVDPDHTTEATGQGGAFDATQFVYGDTSAASMALSKSELSDHLPVWAEFDTSGVDDD